MNLRVNLERIKKNLLEVAQLANAGNVGYSRPAFSEKEKVALTWLKNKLHSLSSQVRQDQVGNVFGRLGPSDEPAIAFGSHLDTVPNGGLYDGALGVVVGLECLQVLVENNYCPSIPLELICFVGEEANPLGGTFGSRATAGLIPFSKELERNLERFHFTWEDVASCQKTKQDYLSFLELHIEQGSLLESNQKSIGVVTSITGMLRLGVKVLGKARHAGTTPMNDRIDSLVHASSLIQEVYRLAMETNGKIVATVGEIYNHPNVANVVPGETDLTIEIRGDHWKRIKETETSIRHWIQENIQAEIDILVEKYPNPLSSSIQEEIVSVCEGLNVTYQSMFSGANHDANSMTALTNVGMIFVPSKDGISHHPDEFTSWEDIETGSNVLLGSILKLSEHFKN